jgi:hypothetical protein
LIGADTIITAGHCVQNELAYSELKITFGWTLKKSRTGSLPAQEVYSCQKILAHKNTQRDGDYTILKLDRPVRNVRPVAIAQHEPRVRDRVVSLSHPLGLLLKSDVGFVTRNEPSLHFFETEFDTFTGSSGSGLFNSAGELLGILSSGSEDIHEDDIRRVQTSGEYLNFKRCDSGSCRAERYFKVKSILSVYL